jgi:hypothetical protein
MLDLSKQYVRDDLADLRFNKNTYIVLKNAELGKLYSRMLKKDFISTENVIIEHENFLYIDEVVNHNDKCEQLENFIFDILENQVKKNGFLYIVFKINSQSLQQLIDDGVCEWLEYMMLYFKFTRLNILMKVDDEDIIDSLPIAYQIVKKINNPRLSLLCDISNENLVKLPEDFNTVTKMIGNKVADNKFVYSNFKIS